jgi:hypothetical protein
MAAWYASVRFSIFSAAAIESIPAVAIMPPLETSLFYVARSWSESTNDDLQLPNRRGRASGATLVALRLPLLLGYSDFAMHEHPRSGVIP